MAAMPELLRRGSFAGKSADSGMFAPNEFFVERT